MITVDPDVRYIGTDDDSLDLFEAQYPLTDGISYNSWLIADEQTAVVDAVDRRRCDNWLRRLSEAAAGRRPDYIIIQHMEPDHSGSVLAFADKYPEARIVATDKALKMLANFFPDTDWAARSIAVADGDTLSLGATTLRFFTAPMVHWPEVMTTYDERHGIVFTADAFGSFALADSDSGWPGEARRYYTNIVGKYGRSVQALIAKLEPLAFKAIAPLHGAMLTGAEIDRALELYRHWSAYTPEEEGVLIAYASVYGATARAALMLADMISASMPAVTIDLCRHDVSEAVAQTFRFPRLALAATTYDGAIFPAMHNFLHHLAMKGMRNRRVAIIENGSWAPQSGRLMAEAVGAMAGMTIVEPRLTIHSALHPSDITTLRDIADALTAPITQ